MAQSGKIKNKMSSKKKRIMIKIMGISEMRWPGSNYCNIDEHRVYYSQTSDGEFCHGVGVIVDRLVAQYVSERILLLQISKASTDRYCTSTGCGAETC